MNPDVDAPKALRDAILRFGGVNKYGKPMWRVCLAQHCTAMRGGVFITMPGGMLEQYTLGPDGKTLISNEIKPDSVKHGIMEVPRYPHVGWILERWHPASDWGTREQWEAAKSSDGITPMMGPYPSEGQYFLFGGPWDACPTISDVEVAIQHYERDRAKRPRDFEAAVARLIRKEEDNKQKQYEKMVAELEQYHKSEIMPVLQSTSLNAQAVRNQIQKRLGLKSHLGIANL